MTFCWTFTSSTSGRNKRNNNALSTCPTMTRTSREEKRATTLTLLRIEGGTIYTLITKLNQQPTKSILFLAKTNFTKEIEQRSTPFVLI